MSKEKKADRLIRDMSAKDIDMVLQWRNHEDIRCCMYTKHEISKDEHVQWFEDVCLDSSRYPMIFEYQGIPAGFVSFTLHDNNAVADWGFYLAPDAIKGTGRYLGLAALDYAFDELGIYKICGSVIANNERSIRLHHSLGFQQEGVLRDHHFYGNKFYNVHCFGLLRDEWKQTGVQES